ncbi:glucagon-like peptide 2 receptor isoform X2 [Pygocentrus nattereri]|uniref:Glucagon like peptide 2 receptor n=1 Tax=Pygocentrus nattereri TaxID=42514 RepID=A0A3B4D9W7_PYGNA|nr:glucagon-like peptide 2 receptor isoform X2 [Pygocentrus nattereri]
MFTVSFPQPVSRLAGWGTMMLSTLLLLLSFPGASGSILEDLIYKRAEYQENCTQTLAATLHTVTGIYCNGTWDAFICWPHSSPGIVGVPCPPYLPWIKEGSSGNAYRICTINGTWKTQENSSLAWRDESECEDSDFFKNEEDEIFHHSVLRILSIVGYSLSLASLSLAVLIMGLLRKLHCTRNYIHMNLFVSFMFRAMAVITKEIVFYIMYSNVPKDENGWNSYVDSTMSLVCKASKVSMQYFVGCNYFWLLVEAIFLHTLLFTAVLTKRSLLKRYVLVGWGTPVLFVAPWTVVKILYENKGCWFIINRWIWWIIRAPITLAVLVIFCIFLKIIKLLLSKLKADQVKFTDYRYSLARATLVLIPLLGIHEIVFTIIIDETIQGKHRYVRNFINLTLSSFQGFLVAVLYCFANGEVQAELKNRWQVYLFANHFEVHNCFTRMHPKHLWKKSRKAPRHPTDHSDSYEDGSHVPTRDQAQLTQVTVQSAVEEVSCARCTGLEFYTRKSLSSSDGEMTLGETMEEILEESEF